MVVFLDPVFPFFEEYVDDVFCFLIVSSCLASLFIIWSIINAISDGRLVWTKTLFCGLERQLEVIGHCLASTNNLHKLLFLVALRPEV